MKKLTVLLLAYFYMSGCLYVPPRGLPLPSEGLEERLELDIREAEARGDAGAARMLYTLQEVEVAGWLRSLQLRQVNLPDALKDEAFLIVGERRTH